MARSPVSEPPGAIADGRCRQRCVRDPRVRPHQGDGHDAGWPIPVSPRRPTWEAHRDESPRRRFTPNSGKLIAADPETRPASAVPTCIARRRRESRMLRRDGDGGREPRMPPGPRWAATGALLALALSLVAGSVWAEGQPGEPAGIEADPPELPSADQPGLQIAPGRERLALGDWTLDPATRPTGSDAAERPELPGAHQPGFQFHIGSSAAVPR